MLTEQLATKQPKNKKMRKLTQVDPLLCHTQRGIEEQTAREYEKNPRALEPDDRRHGVQRANVTEIDQAFQPTFDPSGGVGEANETVFGNEDDCRIAGEALDITSILIVALIS